MFAQTFRFGTSHFHSRVRSAFEPRKPRHRLLRFALGVIGLGVLAVLVAFSVALGAAMIVAGMLYKLWKTRGKRLARAQHDARIVEGEFRVVDASTIEMSAIERPHTRTTL